MARARLDSVLLGPLGFGNVLLPPLLLLLLTVPGLDHLRQLPGEQGAGDEERREGEDDRGQEAVRVLGCPLHHVLGPSAEIDHRSTQDSTTGVLVAASLNGGVWHCWYCRNNTIMVGTVLPTGRLGNWLGLHQNAIYMVPVLSW